MNEATSIDYELRSKAQTTLHLRSEALTLQSPDPAVRLRPVGQERESRLSGRSVEDTVQRAYEQNNIQSL